VRRHLSDKPSSTIGRRKHRIHISSIEAGPSTFAAVLEGLPEAPQYFKHNAAMNREARHWWTGNAPLPAELPATPELNGCGQA